MRTFNVRFRNEIKLKEYINFNHISDSKNILIQIFTADTNKDKIVYLQNMLKRHIPHATLVGSTTDGEIIDSKVLTGNIIISFSIFENTTISSCFIDNCTDEYKIMQELKSKVIKDNSKAILFFLNNCFIDAQSLASKVYEYKKEMVISGALAADNGKFEKSYVFDGEHVSDNAIVAITLNSDTLKAINRFNYEWEPIGRELKVTKSKDNIIYEVDGISIKNVYEKYLGKNLASKLPLSGTQFPLVIKSGENYVARSCLRDLGDGSLLFGTHIKEGEIVQIGSANIESIINNAQLIYNDILKNPVESIFIYSSAARRRFLREDSYYEIEPFSQIAPNVGFFTTGQFFSNESGAKFLNQTLCALSLSESQEIRVEHELLSPSKVPHDLNYETIKALTNIAKVSSDELQELNQQLENKIENGIELNRKKDRILIHNSRLAQMGEMMSLIAHQWRQPLSAISATSTGLHVKLEFDKYDHDFFVDALLKIETYVNHLSSTIDDFANFFKPTKKKEAVYIHEIIQKSLFIMSPSLTKAEVKVVQDVNSFTKIDTYPNELIQVVINLIKNAENVLLKRGVKNPTISITAYEKEEKHYIEICDNAGGIEDNIIDKIFEPYFSTKENENSTGLGLYMSKFIIEESCNGILNVINENNGAKFTIIL
jgi:hypothetical protein